MQRLGVYLCCSSVLSCLLAGVSYAQSAATATIVGRVVDPQGAVLLDARVTAINTATGVSRSVNTTSSGDYTVPNLPPGTYDIKVQAPGFAVGEAKGIKLNVGDQQDLNFKLALAGTSQTVVATVEAPLIETTKTDVSTSVTDVDMRRLPTLNGAAGVANDYAQLALSAPGVKLDTSSLSREPIGPGSINNRGNLYNVDGGNVTDQINSGRLGGIGASVDEIQEFQVLTNNYNAEYGQAGGLIINAVTKSGDNGIHGDGHMYFRGRNLAASNFFYNLRLGTPSDGAPRAPFHRKEGGFTLGGPFKKDKLFWFASYELSRQSAPQTLTPPSGTITVQQPVNDLLYSGKLQYTPSDKHTFTVRYNVDRQFFDNQVSETGNNITPDDVTSIRIHSLGVNVGFVSTLTPTLVNEARFFFYRTINTKLDKTTLPGQQHPDFASGANFCCPLRGSTKRYQYMDNLTWTRSSHSVKAGFNISYYPWFSLFQQFHFGQYGDFTTPTTPRTFTIGLGPGQVTSKDNIYGLYAQDTWKITRKLTMNYGLRYDDEAGAFRGGFIAGPNGTCFQGNRIIPACSSDKNNFQPRLGFTYAPWQHWLLKASFAETTVLAFNNVALDSLNFDGATLNTVTIDKTTAAGLAVLAAFPNAPSTTLLAPFAPGGTNFGRVRPISDHLRNPEMRSVNFGIQHEFTRTLVGEIQYIGQFGFGLFGERDVNYPVIAADPAHSGFFYFQDRPDPRFTAVRTNENSRTSHYNGLLVSATKRLSQHVQFVASYTWSHALTSGEDFFGLSEPGDPRNIRAELGPAFNDIRHAANFNLLLDSRKVTDRSAARWLANDLTVGFLGQLQSGRPYPVSTGTAGFASERFFGVGNETQQRPNVLADGTLSTAGIASSTGSNLLIGPGGVAACIASGQPAALCNSIQNAFLAPVGASALGAVDSLTGDIVDFRFLNGNVGRDAGRGAPFCRLDVSLQKIFKLARAEKVSFELRADAFNIFNHTNFQGFNSNDVLAVLGLSLDSVTHAPKSDFFTCRSCMRPDGTYVGASGQVLHLSDLQHGKVSKDLIKPVFGGIGDPATADIPRTLQLSFHVRF
jgi:Carboxypeptidase regulatory-like domain/TonB dependent receptor